ncbi:MAG: endonuclease [Chloroflexi bacterium]|nr:endonuclease [Chloroflexota bacterium]
MAKENSYSRIIEDIFLRYFKDGDSLVFFAREDIVSSAERLDISLPKNLGDVVYAFRHRRPLPDAIVRHSPEGQSWVIVGKGRAKYAFELKPVSKTQPDQMLPVTKIPDATPGIVARYALTDEQALLAKLRNNRLVDIFTGVTCYSIQNHLRTTVRSIGQIETDEIYVGIDKRGAHFILPVQAKGKADQIGVVQIEQDLALCDEKFPELVARPIAAQFMDEDSIALFEFGKDSDGAVVKLAERHYRLVPESEMSSQDLQLYRNRRAD